MSHDTPTPPSDPHADALRAGRGRTWLPLLAAVLLNLGLIAAAWLALPGLPDHIPTHWGADGRPDAWEETSLGSLALGPLIVLGTCAAMALCVPLARAASAHGCVSAQWLRTKSRQSEMPDSRRVPHRDSKSSIVPRFGCTSR